MAVNHFNFYPSPTLPKSLILMPFPLWINHELVPKHQRPSCTLSLLGVVMGQEKHTELVTLSYQFGVVFELINPDDVVIKGGGVNRLLV